MFGAELRYLDTGINVFHHFVANAVYLVAEYQADCVSIDEGDDILRDLTRRMNILATPALVAGRPDHEALVSDRILERVMDAGAVEDPVSAGGEFVRVALLVLWRVHQDETGKTHVHHATGHGPDIARGLRVHEDDGYVLKR